MFGLIYKVMPRQRVLVADVWLGALLAALLFTGGQVVIGAYIGRNGVASGVGAAGSLVVVLLWVYFSAQILLMGTEFTCVYARTFGSRSPHRRDRRQREVLTRADPLNGTNAIIVLSQPVVAATQRTTMNLRAFSLTLILAFALLAAFDTLNWMAIAIPSTLSLGFFEVSAPLGMVLLVFTAAISGPFIIYIVLLQAGVILEARRLTKEVKAQRELADTAEASRFTELRTLLEGELHRIESQGAASSRELGARIEQSERGMQDKLAEATGTLSAYLGEIEDKLDRALVPAHAQGMAPQPER